MVAPLTGPCQAHASHTQHQRARASMQVRFRNAYSDTGHPNTGDGGELLAARPLILSGTPDSEPPIEKRFCT